MSNLTRERTPTPSGSRDRRAAASIEGLRQGGRRSQQGSAAHQWVCGLKTSSTHLFHILCRLRRPLRGAAMKGVGRDGAP
ncbi:hypothetical protein Q8A67_012747 [Cirrhinus molitorella]|uniref:Uncharacterized protein n=1 Tax=Cirrhinus molitorella TaxID=172907 RepID=A0AA88TW63_9TELE|nr:hypothetical protein Q8A67_012747 [Cirrhinus molitorella]